MGGGPRVTRGWICRARARGGVWTEKLVSELLSRGETCTRQVGKPCWASLHLLVPGSICRPRLFPVTCKPRGGRPFLVVPLSASPLQVATEDGPSCLVRAPEMADGKCIRARNLFSCHAVMSLGPQGEAF